jgi:benzaldehyde dehydrogenase (NAD)
MATPAIREQQMFINGRWCGAIDGNTFRKENPFSGAAVSPVAASGRADVRSAVEAAAAAFPAWSGSAPGMRRSLFLKAANVLDGDGDVPYQRFDGA